MTTLRQLFEQLNRQLPTRYFAVALALLWLAASGIAWWTGNADGAWPLTALLFTGLGVRDLLQSRHAVIRNYPVVGHLRYFFEFIRPEIRQYFIESDTDATPFSRQQRAIVYQRAKQELDKLPFGSQLDVYGQGYEWINHSLKPGRPPDHDFRVQIGGPQCTRPYSASVFNISAMSFGALSANAIRALNRGARDGRFAHDTGEGSISSYHREFGGDLIWEIGSGYFGCRNEAGDFDEARFVANATLDQVKMIEIKLSQGAKPGHGGVLPGAKVTSEIAHARGVPIGVDCVSPAAHSAFDTPLGLLQFVARLRELSGGKPTGFKLAIGHPWEWLAIAKAMLVSGITPDFIVIDGKEGGTGAAPVEFIDHVGMPMQDALRLVHNTLVGIKLRAPIKLGAAGRIITAFDVARTLAIGADWVNSARGFMFALGCIQSQSCHTGSCPTGVATQSQLRQRALVVTDKATRVSNFHRNTLRALAELIAAAGLDHPSQLEPSHIMRRVERDRVLPLSVALPSLRPGELLDGYAEIDPFARYWSIVDPNSFALKLV